MATLQSKKRQIEAYIKAQYKSVQDFTKADYYATERAIANIQQKKIELEELNKLIMSQKTSTNNGKDPYRRMDSGSAWNDPFWNRSRITSIDCTGDGIAVKVAYQYSESAREYFNELLNGWVKGNRTVK